MTATRPGGPPPFLVGPRVVLRALVESDATGVYPSWFNDEEVCRGNSHHVFPFSQEEALEYIRASARSRELLVLAVTLRADGCHIGNIALERMKPVDGSAEFAIVIGDRSAWAKGYATEAARLICQHGFRALNLHRIGCGTFDDNEPMKRLAARLGMREEGRRREAAYKDGRYVDVVEYGVLKDEFAAHAAAAAEE